jgi:hypothetical protein
MEHTMQVCSIAETQQVWGQGFWDFLIFDSGTSGGVRNDGQPLGSGCGTALLDGFVPDVMFGINLQSSCAAHDNRYNTCNFEKAEADRLFRSDILVSCESQGGNGLLCNVIATAYGLGVSLGGAKAYATSQENACLNPY